LFNEAAAEASRLGRESIAEGASSGWCWKKSSGWEQRREEEERCLVGVGGRMGIVWERRSHERDEVTL
jgi:hypothetical protein